MNVMKKLKNIIEDKIEGGLHHSEHSLLGMGRLNPLIQPIKGKDLKDIKDEWDEFND